MLCLHIRACVFSSCGCERIIGRFILCRYMVLDLYCVYAQIIRNSWPNGRVRRTRSTHLLPDRCSSHRLDNPWSRTPRVLRVHNLLLPAISTTVTPATAVNKYFEVYCTGVVCERTNATYIYAPICDDLRPNISARYHDVVYARTIHGLGSSVRW